MSRLARNDGWLCRHGLDRFISWIEVRSGMSDVPVGSLVALATITFARSWSAYVHYDLHHFVV